MKSIQIELPDKLTQELDAMVKAGWFINEAEIVRLALLEFIRHHRLELHEKFQREDIAWALKQKGATPSMVRVGVKSHVASHQDRSEVTQLWP
jgi:Arc/MetJ-type ribon-helix-helix transcriptional regulator